jgi:hypothetical protein
MEQRVNEWTAARDCLLVDAKSKALDIPEAI